MLLTLVDQLGRTTKHAYDANRNETKRTNALGEVTTYTYDTNGNQTSSTNVALNEKTTTTYNAFSEPVTTTNPIGNTTTIAYDVSGLPTSFTDSMGLLATFMSSEHGLPITVTDVVGNTVSLNYDASGDLTSRTDRLGRVTSYHCDGTGRPRSTTDPRGGETDYVYDFDARLVGTETPLGFGVLGGRDLAGNVETRQEFNGTRREDFDYDADNHRQGDRQHRRHLRRAQYLYDFRGNELSTTDEVGKTTSFTTSTTWPAVWSRRRTPTGRSRCRDTMP